MLKEKNKHYFRKWLTQCLNENLEKAQDTVIDITHVKDRFSDELDQTAVAVHMGFALRIRDREAKLIRKIRYAFERLQDGTFGICEECGEEIPLKRLKARPVTTLCIGCKEEQEAEERTKAEEYPIADY